MTATTAFFHFAKKIHNRRRIPENPRIVAVGDVKQNKNELKSAVDACIANDPTGMSCTKNGVHISKWDVSKVTTIREV